MEPIYSENRPKIYRSLQEIPEFQSSILGRREFFTQSLFPIEKWSVSRGDSSRILIAKNINHQAMAVAEASGLLALEKRGARVPRVYGIVEEKNSFILLMSYCGGGSNGNRDQKLRDCLIGLYSHSPNPTWGWEENNYIGTLLQKNAQYKNFNEYWLLSRIIPMLDQIENNGISTLEWRDLLLRKVEASISNWNLNSHQPRLVHGDLWGGNILFHEDTCYLIDPSVSFGNPEQDLAMLSLFGSPLSTGSRESILEFLNQRKEWKDREPFWLVYPLLVHIAIFGESYTNQLLGALGRLPGK